MKKYLLFSIMALGFAASAGAQSKLPERIVKVSTDTSLNVDTVIVSFQGLASGVKGFQGTVKKVTGTVGGIVLLQGTINGNDWVNVNTDTLTVTNQAINTHVWPLTSTSYFSYRLWYKSTASTQTSTLSMSYMRRPDE